MADLAIEETNRIRASLGMKPLPVPGGGPSFKSTKDEDSETSSEEEQGSTLESRQAQGYDNWKQLQDEADAKRKREAKAEAIKKARDAAQKFSRLEGKGLADDGEGEADTKTWLLQQKKRRKRIEKEREKAERLEKELAEREATEHTAADLSGVNVTHSLEDFEGGEEQVLTLKDATIDQNEEEGDELENLDLREREALNEKLNSKRKKPVYDPHAEGEEGGSTILKHYDETIDGKKRKRFQLDGQGVSAEDREAMKQAVGERLKAKPISLDIVKDDTPISDYAEIVEAKIKKPKKKKPKTSRQKAVDEDDIFPLSESSAVQTHGNDMEVDVMNGQQVEAGSRPTESASFVDDDDLQASLATQRRAALKKRKRATPEDIARQLREEASATPGAMEIEEPAEESGLIIDETTEFVANLQRAKEEEDEQPRTANARRTATLKEESLEENKEDVEMDGTYNDIEDEENLQTRLKREISAPAKPDMTGTGLEDEATLNQGLGSTLSMLSQRGLIDARREEDIAGLHRDRQRFLLEKQKREADIERKARLQRERDRASGKLDHMSAREREEYARYENKQRDQLESRQMTDIFNREYKPDVQLKYVDEFGRSMNQKEAFKHLSHQFHGKGSGKQKTEKHLKKIDDDKKREAQTTLDASQATGMNNAMGATAKKNRQAGVRLA
ncbi:MAG: hypothetical protein Q9164_004425 [Protoblastenia rupestris]